MKALVLALTGLFVVTSASAEGVRNRSRVAAPQQPLPWEQPAPANVKFHNFELGVFGTYDWGREDSEGYKGKPIVDHLDGFGFGGFASYTARPDSRLAAGVEIDALRMFNEAAVADWLMSLRARVGYYVTPAIMPYVTGGVALEPTTMDYGWVAGGGVQYDVGPSNSLRLEYLHYDIEDISGVDIQQEILKVSFGWKF